MPRFSSRLPWHTPPNRLSVLLTEKRRARPPLLDLTVSNPTENRGYPHSAIRDALAKASDLAYHPDPFGVERARLAVTNYYAGRGITANEKRIALTASTSEAYSLLFKLLCDAGDEILVPVPSYPLFDHLAALENVRATPYRLGYDGSWFIDFEHLRSQISRRARAIVIVNPNNPTGSFLKEHERSELFAAARKHDLAIISDEVFLDYTLTDAPGRVRTLIGEDEVVSFSLSGLSKAAAMPQMKLAWMAINGPEEECESIRQRLELLLDTYLSVNTPVQLALNNLLGIGDNLRREIRTRALANLDSCRRMLAESPVHTLHVEGGWSVVLQLPRTVSEEEWVWRLLDEKNVVLQPGFFFDMPSEAYAVASLITEPDIFAEGIARLYQLVKSA